MRRALAVVLLAAGCVPSTGLMVEVQGPDGVTSTQAGIAQLDFVVAHPSWCERWVGVAPAMHTKVSVAGRDLTKKPYDFLITPSHQTDLSQPLYAAALAYDAGGALLGEASFDNHPLAKDQVVKRTAKIYMFAHSGQAAPRYVADDGCVCTPGEPWVGTGSGSGCDTRVVTSFDRLIDTAQCELTPKGSAPPVPVCDGQQFLDEPNNRDLPCWAADPQGACRVKTRRCNDQFGVAYNEECVTGTGDVMLPAGSNLCARYLACEQMACSDVIGCMRAGFGQKLALKCTLHVDPATPANQKIKPCGTSNWTATLTTATAGGACLGVVLDGVQQPPYTIGLSPPTPGAAVAIASVCPTVLQVDAIDAPYPDAVPATKELDVVLGDHLAHITITVARDCTNTGTSSLTCTTG
jgi:hypothetical protein